MSEWGKKGDLSNFEHGMVVGIVSISQSAQLLGFSRTTISRGQNALLLREVRGEWAD